MNAKKNLALLLALLMLGSQFASCSESTDNADTDAAGTTAPDAADATTPVEEETVDPNARVDDGLEDGVTFDGYTYNIFQHTAVYKDFQAEEITGEPINDADFERQTARCVLRSSCPWIHRRAGYPRRRAYVRHG